MEIKLYHTTSPVNKIGKTLTDETSYECKFKKDSTCDILNPIVYIYSENYIDFNFAYIEQFHRYYFVNNVVIFPNNIYKLELSVDVLETYKDSILKNTIHVTQKENSNMDGANITPLNSRQYQKIEFDSMFKLQRYFVLVTSVGGFK